MSTRHWRQIPKDELQRIVSEHDTQAAENKRLPDLLDVVEAAKGYHKCSCGIHRNTLGDALAKLEQKHDR